MQKQLIDENLLQIIEWIKSIEGILYRLRNYPLELLRTGEPVIKRAGDNKVMGLGVYAWALEALLRLSARPYERGLIDLEEEYLDNLKQKALHKFSWNEKVGKNEQDAFWVISGYRAFWILEHLCPQGSEEFIKEKRKYWKTLSQKRKEFFPNMRNPFYCFRLFRLLQARILSGETYKSLVKGVAIQKHVSNLLSEELSTLTCSSSILNHMMMAIAAYFVFNLCIESRDQLNLGEPRRTIIRKLESACHAALVDTRDFTESRLIQAPHDIGFLNNFYWEDIYIYCGVGVEHWPDLPSIIPRMLDWYSLRLNNAREQFECNEIVEGVTDETLPEFPAVAPVSTCFSICLLDALKMQLRKMIEFLLCKNIRNMNPAVMATKAKDLKGLLNTEEGTKKRLLEEFVLSDGEVQDLSKKNRILIFGPPGTGKTTLAEALYIHLNPKQKQGAKRIFMGKKKWSFVQIDPHFLLISDNYSQIMFHFRQTLQVLKHLYKCIVFFDEVEELMRSRKYDTERLGRMFTSSMLPFFNSLKPHPNIYFFATNYIKFIDEAAIRRGRFAIRKGVSVVDQKYAKKIAGDKWESVKKCVACLTPVGFLKGLDEDGTMSDNFSERIKDFQLNPRILLDHAKDVENYDDDPDCLGKAWLSEIDALSNIEGVSRQQNSDR